MANMNDMNNMENMDNIINTLKTSAKMTLLLVDKHKDSLIIIKHIYHILNIFLRNNKIYKNEIKQLNSICSSILYATPFDEESIIFEHYEKLCEYLCDTYPKNTDIEIIIQEDLKNITLLQEIEKILQL